MMLIIRTLTVTDPSYSSVQHVRSDHNGRNASSAIIAAITARAYDGLVSWTNLLNARITAVPYAPAIRASGSSPLSSYSLSSRKASSLEEKGMSLLSLHDEDLHSIFLLLGSQTFDDSTDEESLDHHRHSRNLASCCKRLYSIYQTSVECLTLANCYGPDDCQRLRRLFPCVNHLDLNLASVLEYFTKTPWYDWIGTPQDYPAGLVRNGTKTLFLFEGVMKVTEVQAMMESFTGLAQLYVARMSVVTDRETFKYTDEECTFSLEHHATTLKYVTISSTSIEKSPDADAAVDPPSHIEVDLRFLQLPSLTVLEDLELSGVLPHPCSYNQLTALTDLEVLTFRDSKIQDEALKTILPSLPQLLSLRLDGCKKLTNGVLAWLPPLLDFLSISRTNVLILTLEPGTVSPIFPQHPFTALEGAKIVKNLRCDKVTHPHFGNFLQYYHGESIEILSLFDSDFQRSDLVHILSNTPNLIELNLGFGSRKMLRVIWRNSELLLSMDKNVFDAISKLGSLRELKLDESVISDQCLSRLVSGPCRFSLRSIDLRNCPNIRDLARARRLFSDRFSECSAQ